MILKTRNLLNLLPKQFRKTTQDQLILNILESSKRSLEEKQVLLLQQQTQFKSFKSARKAAVLKARPETFKSIQEQISILISSKEHVAKPYYYLFKSWLGNNNKKQLLCELVYSMSQLALMREEMTHQNFVYQIGVKFLSEVIEIEKKEVCTIPNMGPGELYFRRNIFNKGEVQNLVTRRLRSLVVQSRNSSLSLLEREELLGEMETLKRVTYQIENYSCIVDQSAKNDYGFTTWTDNISLGNNYRGGTN